MTYPPPEQPYQPAPQQPQQPPVPVKTGANKVLVIILAIVLLLCLGCGGFGAYWFFQIKNKVEEVVDSIPTDFPTTNDGGAVAPGSSHKVRYEVTGTGTVRMVWAEKTVGVGNIDVQLPWTKEFTLNEPNFGAQVIAVPKGASDKPDTCKIFIDGVEKKSAKYVSQTLQCSFVYVSK